MLKNKENHLPVSFGFTKSNSVNDGSMIQAIGYDCVILKI